MTGRPHLYYKKITPMLILSLLFLIFCSLSYAWVFNDKPSPNAYNFFPLNNVTDMWNGEDLDPHIVAGSLDFAAYPVFDAGLSLDGSTGCFDTQGSDSLYLTANTRGKLADGEFSISLWFRSSQVDAGEKYIFRCTISTEPISNYMALQGGKIEIANFDGGWDSIQSTGSYNDNAWHHIIYTLDSNNGSMIIDGVNEGNYITTGYADGGATFCSLGYPSSGSMVGQIDHVMVFDNALSQAEIEYLYLYGYTEEGPVAPDTDLELFFKDEDNIKTNETFFHEHMTPYINFTYVDNGTVIADSDCAAYFNETSIENRSIGADFTLCSAGCDHSRYEEELFLDETDADNDVQGDFINIELCRNSPDQEGLTIDINCSSNTDQILIGGSNIEQCSLGFNTLTREITGCTSEYNINVTLTDSAAFPNRLNISHFHIYRTIHDYITENLAFSGGLYYYHPIAFHKEGQYLAIGNCSNAALSGNDDLNITVTKTEDSIIINSYYTDMFYNFGDDSVIEYTNAPVQLGIIFIFDLPIDDFNVTIFNENSSIMQQNKSLDIGANVTIPPYLLVDFQNSLNITIWANDTAGNTAFRSYNFSVKDTSSPICSGLDNENILNASSYDWHVSCTDEYFWSLNISCAGLFDYYKEGIGETSFLYENSTVISDDITCSYEYCDGHTDDDIDFHLLRLIGDIKQGANSLEFEDNKLLINSSILNFKTIDLEDRIKFCVTPAAWQDSILFDIPKNCILAHDSPYTGHYICGGWWLDFEQENKEFSSYFTKDKAVIDFGKMVETPKEICFDSIGKLNCVSGSKTFTTYEEGPAYNIGLISNTNWFNTDALDTGTTAGVMIFFFIFCMIIALFVAGEVSQIPILMLLAAIGGFFFGILVFVQISAIIGLIACILSIMYGIRGVME